MKLEQGRWYHSKPTGRFKVLGFSERGVVIERFDLSTFRQGAYSGWISLGIQEIPERKLMACKPLKSYAPA